MSHPLSTAETKASSATALAAFSRFSLEATRTDLVTLLNSIGMSPGFREYTLHDFSHVQRSLEFLDWLLIEDTVNAMTSVDWLLLVLSLYLHDAGMLVTKEEYDGRDRTSFQQFKERANASVGKKDGYPHRMISEYSEIELEEFFYGEFVREHHAERVGSWILGQPRPDLGHCDIVFSEIQNLLRELPDEFKRDLALVCESHHREDLHDLRKYRPNQQYGTGSQETANVQFAAIMLRTSDLLDITSARTPSVLFRLLSPTNPKSQLEWAKQSKVRSVSSKLGINTDGRPDPTAIRTTIQVWATFTDPEPYFGLTDYLRYVEKQLQQCEHWARMANDESGVQHRFPWKSVDTTNVDVLGYDDTPFEFTIDQDRVLELLTGHRLYDNTDVVIRELAQNAIDAVRTQHLSEKHQKQHQPIGNVQIKWNSSSNLVSIADNGTGMTYDVIKNHLLRVGSSRYQQDSFKDEFPDFNPISRFGIGVLTAFMISDEVTITTSHPSESQVRQLLLRSAQGKYLVKKLDRASAEVPELIREHGTQVDLRIRDVANLGSVLSITKRWIIVPECQVDLYIDDDAPIRISHPNVKVALEEELKSLRESGLLDNRDQEEDRFEIRSGEIEGVSLAYVVRWNDYFKQWEYFSLTRLDSSSSDSRAFGTCIEGIRVETTTPGFSDRRLMALANFSGQSAPATNVARSGIERDRAFIESIRKVYSILVDHVKNEIKEMDSSRRNFSKSRAAHEAEYLLSPLLRNSHSVDFRYLTRDVLEQDIIAKDILFEEIRDVPMLLVEIGPDRSLFSMNDLANHEQFWTINSQLMSSANDFLRQIAGNSSIGEIMSVVDPSGHQPPNDLVLAEVPHNAELRDYIFANREPSELIVTKPSVRVDIAWSLPSPNSRWSEPDLRGDAVRGSRLMVQRLTEADSRRGTIDPRRLYNHSLSYSVFVEEGNVKWSGLEDEIGILTNGKIFLKRDSTAGISFKQIFDYFSCSDTLADGAALGVATGLLIARLMSTPSQNSTTSLDSISEMVETLVAASAFTTEMDRRIVELVMSSPIPEILNTPPSPSATWRIYNQDHEYYRMQRKL